VSFLPYLPHFLKFRVGCRYTVLDATDVARSTSPITPLKSSFRIQRNLRRDVYSSNNVLNVPAIVGAVIAIIFIKLMICIWCVWFRRRRYRYVPPVQMYPPAGSGSFPPPPYQGFPSPMNALYPTNPPANLTFPNSPSTSPLRPLNPTYPLTPVSPYVPLKPVEPFNPYVGLNTIPTRRPGGGSTTMRDQQPNNVRPIPGGDGVIPMPAAALDRRENRQPARQDPRITQGDGLATPIPTTNPTRRTTPGSEMASVRPSSGADMPPPPEYTVEDGTSMTIDRRAGGPGRSVNASSDGQPTVSNSDGSAGNGVSRFSIPQPLSFMPIN
jgi:hypothetical protein